MSNLSDFINQSPIKSIQRGVQVCTVAGTLYGTTITAVNRNKAFIVLSTDGGSASQLAVFSGDTGLIFASNTAGYNIQWQVIEYV